jgi:hypothetical protein
MTNSASWWANKLNQQQPQPRGITVQPVQPAQPQPVQPQPVQQQAVQPVAQPSMEGVPLQTGERQQVLDPNRDPNAEVSMSDAMRLWRGGEAHRTEGHMVCPSCGSATGYTAYSGMGAGAARVNGQQPRPHCFECGYNGSFAQGLESNWS